MSTSGGYHEYIGRVFSTSEGYHDYIGGCSVHRGMFSTSEFSIEIEEFSIDFIKLLPHMYHDIPPMY